MFTDLTAVGLLSSIFVFERSNGTVVGQHVDLMLDVGTPGLEMLPNEPLNMPVSGEIVVQAVVGLLVQLC